MTTTKIELDREYVNILQVPSYILTAPDGFKITSKLPITKPMKELFQHAGIAWVKDIQERAVDSITIKVGDLTLTQCEDSPLCYYFKGVSQKSNALEYRQVKKILLSEGYIVMHLSCKDEVDCGKTYFEQIKISKP